MVTRWWLARVTIAALPWACGAPPAGRTEGPGSLPVAANVSAASGSSAGSDATGAQPDRSASPSTPAAEAAAPAGDQCAQRLSASGLPSVPSVERDYPVVLNPRDERGRTIHAGVRYRDGVTRETFCYVAQSQPLRAPDAAAAKHDVACPKAMRSPAWWNCADGRIVTNGEHCPCVCVVEQGMGPPEIRAVGCP